MRGEMRPDLCRAQPSAPGHAQRVVYQVQREECGRSSLARRRDGCATDARLCWRWEVHFRSSDFSDRSAAPALQRGSRASALSGRQRGKHLPRWLKQGRSDMSRI
jgi:hypothetical protein